jgi:hypothetical protein
MKSLILAVAVAGVGTFLIAADGGAQGLPAHDANQTSQHNSLSGQVTTHDSAQTSQHNELKGKIDNLGDHSGLPPTWDKILPANNPGGPCPSNSSRFTCVMGGAAVRDHETGLVWEIDATEAGTNWAGAMRLCYAKGTGGRRGWRPATAEELASLQIPDGSGRFRRPDAPFGRVFTFMWSSTTVAGDTSKAWAWSLPGPNFNSLSITAEPKSACCGTGIWCVRGGQGLDGQ